MLTFYNIDTPSSFPNCAILLQQMIGVPLLIYFSLFFQFATLNDAATTLFALINGDEIYATFAMLDAKKTGGSLLIPIIYKIYIGTYVAIFTIIVVNLLIALFTNAYDSIKVTYYTLNILTLITAHKVVSGQ